MLFWLKNKISKLSFLSSESRVKLDFFVVGAQKSGTTSINAYLKNHPSIQMPRRKELHFFDHENSFYSTEVDYSELHNWFDFTVGDAIKRGESTPIYMYWEPCIQRLWQYNRQLKLIAILRNPVERAYSHWNMEYSRGNEIRSFEESIKEEITSYRGSYRAQDRIKSYIDRGLYSHQIKRIKKFFPDDQLLFIKYEQFRDNEYSCLEEIFDFLAVDPWIPEEGTLINKGHYSEPISIRDKKFLFDVFEKDIIETERLLDWDCSDWKL